MTDGDRQLGVQAFARCVWGQDIIRGKIIDNIMTWVTDERAASKSAQFPPFPGYS